jgi:hypothetical protein
MVVLSWKGKTIFQLCREETDGRNGRSLLEEMKSSEALEEEGSNTGRT